MKKRFKVILVLVVCCAAILSILKIHTAGAEISHLNVGFNYSLESVNLDPRSLEWSFDFEIANNVFGRLLRKDDEGQLVVDLPSKMTISSNNIIDFEFSNHTKSASGVTVSAKDAFFTLKRMLLKEAGQHDELRLLICPGEPLSGMNSNCDGLRLQGNHLLISVARPSYLSLVLNLLNREDYSILMASQIDLATGKLLPGFMEETTGAYFVSSAPGKQVELSANTGSYYYSTKMPQKVNLISAKSEQSLAGFKAGEIEFLQPNIAFASDLGREILSDRKNRIYKTLPLRVVLVFYTDSGLRDFTASQRLRFGRVIAQANKIVHVYPDSAATLELFQPLSWGSLGAKDLELVKFAQKVQDFTPAKRKLRLKVTKKDEPKFRELLRNDPEIELLTSAASLDDLPKEQWPDAAIMLADSSEEESITTIRAAINSQLKTMNVDPSEWLTEYLNIDSKDDRQQKLRDAHRTALLNGTLFPIEATPFIAVLQPGFKLETSKFNATTALWIIRRD